jgi:hypothetical protein
MTVDGLADMWADYVIAKLPHYPASKRCFDLNHTTSSPTTIHPNSLTTRDLQILHRKLLTKWHPVSQPQLQSPNLPSSQLLSALSGTTSSWPASPTFGPLWPRLSPSMELPQIQISSNGLSRMERSWRSSWRLIPYVLSPQCLPAEG